MISPNNAAVILITILILIIIAQAISNVFTKITATKREKDLLNRLMATDFREYVEGEIHLKEHPTAPTAEEVAEALSDQEDSQGYVHNGIPV